MAVIRRIEPRPAYPPRGIGERLIHWFMYDKCAKRVLEPIEAEYVDVTPVCRLHGSLNAHPDIIRALRGEFKIPMLETCEEERNIHTVADLVRYMESRERYWRSVAEDSLPDCYQCGGPTTRGMITLGAIDGPVFVEMQVYTIACSHCRIVKHRCPHCGGGMKGASHVVAGGVTIPQVPVVLPFSIGLSVCDYEYVDALICSRCTQSPVTFFDLATKRRLQKMDRDPERRRRGLERAWEFDDRAPYSMPVPPPTPPGIP